MIFCAEVGSNHKGVPAIAHEMIRRSKLAGADIVKFQFRDPNDKIRGMALRYALTLKKWCDYFEIEFMASIFDIEGIARGHMAEMRRAKIAHSIGVQKPNLCKIIMNEFKEGFISHGDYTASGWHNIFVVPGYPTYPDSVVLPESFDDEWYGYSSHVHGYGDALIAVARGAKYIEKHVTLDKTETTIKDNHFALSFDEFRQMVDVGREMGRLVDATSGLQE